MYMIMLAAVALGVMGLVLFAASHRQAMRRFRRHMLHLEEEQPSSVQSSRPPVDTPRGLAGSLPPSPTFHQGSAVQASLGSSTMMLSGTVFGQVLAAEASSEEGPFPPAWRGVYDDFVCLRSAGEGSLVPSFVQFAMLLQQKKGQVMQKHPCVEVQFVVEQRHGQPCVRAVPVYTEGTV